MIGHFDTVWPIGQIDTMPVRREDGRLYGPGSYDMKAGIATTLLAARILIETNRLPSHRITMIWTSDEEVGSAHVARDPRGRGPPQPGRVRARAGAGRRRREDRAERRCGFPDRSHRDFGARRRRARQGASAIHELAWQAVQLLALNDPSRGRDDQRRLHRRRHASERRRGRSDDGCRCQDSDRGRRRAGHDRHHNARPSRPSRASPRERRGRTVRRWNEPQALPHFTSAPRASRASSAGNCLKGRPAADPTATSRQPLAIPTLDGLGPDGAGAHALSRTRPRSIRSPSARPFSQDCCAWTSRSGRPTRYPLVATRRVLDPQSSELEWCATAPSVQQGIGRR